MRSKFSAAHWCCLKINAKTTVSNAWIGIGLLDFLVVLIVHVESDESIRIISMRNADSDETDLFYKNAGYF